MTLGIGHTEKEEPVTTHLGYVTVPSRLVPSALTLHLYLMHSTS